MAAGGLLQLLFAASVAVAVSEIEPDEPLTLSADSIGWLLGMGLWTVVWCVAAVVFWRGGGRSQRIGAANLDSN